MTRPRSFGVPFMAAAVLLLAQIGCLSFLNPVEPVTPAEATACQHIPEPCRGHVYVFFIHGMDPFDCANLGGVRDYVQSLGFIKTYYGQLYHTGYFEDEVRRIHARDPEARFALIGFSFGANMVRSVANAVKDDGIPIDVLVYLGGNTLTNAAEDRPANVGRIVNILATGWIWDGAMLDGAQNINYTDVWHFGSPTHPRTLEVLVHELMGVAAHVPLVEYQFPSRETEPTPRPVEPLAAERRDEWDFLLPGGPIPELPPMIAPAVPGTRRMVRASAWRTADNSPP